VAHELPGNDGCLHNIEAFASRPEAIICLFSQTTHRWSLIKSIRRSMSMPAMQTGTPDPESSIGSRVQKLRGRHPVEAGAEARGMETSPGGAE